MDKPETVWKWSVRTWKERHDQGYFPNSKQHAGWKIYDELPEWFNRFVRPTREDTALEIGAGYGQWMIPLSPQVRSVDGFDIHPIPIQKGRQLFREHGIENANLVLGDGISIPFYGRWFSLIYSISVFQHLPRPMVRNYIHETERVLAPGGRVAHFFRNADDVGPHPKPADDITVGHTGDFSVGWTPDQVAAAAEGFPWWTSVLNLGLHLVLLAWKREAPADG